MAEQPQRINLRIAICDDDPLILKRLQLLAQAALSDRYLLDIYTAQSPKELLALNQVFQIAVLDIQLPENSGIALARALIAQNPECRVIFVSGYVCYVSEVYDVPHMCLILKDQLEEQLPRFLERAAAAAAMQAGQTLVLQENAVKDSLPLCDIAYLERQGHWTYITLCGGRQYRTREKLDDLLQRINCPDFCRCHISYIINLQQVKALQCRQALMANGDAIPISRPHIRNVQETFFRYLSDST